VAALRLTALDGREHRLVDDTPRYRIVNLWARWCAPCRRELPSLQRLAAQLDPRSHALLTIALDDDAFALREYARDLGLTLPIVPLASSALPPRWRARTLPQTLALAPDGALVGRVAGAREWDRPDALAELLGAPRRRSS
jgi:thiol-disulfide isomerase/thioredoxin